MEEVIGELFQKSSGHEWEWQIPGFLSLPEEVGEWYKQFFFSGASWELHLYPNGEEKETEGWVSLYLWRTDTGPSLTVGYSMGVRKADGAEKTLFEEESYTFSKVGGWGRRKFFQRTDIVRRRADLAPTELLTVTCTLKDDRHHSVEGSKQLFTVAEVIGEVFQKSSGLKWEWQIPDFLSLPEEVGKEYRSRKFLFSGACWELRVFPNGQTKDSEGWVSLYLHRRDTGPSLTLGFTMGVRKADGAEEIRVKEGRNTFSKADGWGSDTFLQRTDLVQRRADLAPSELLTVTCTLKDDSCYSMEAALCSRLWNVSVMLQDILASGKGADITFKLEDGELRAHKLILMARSEVFTRMFTSDMKEANDGEVVIPGADKESFSAVLAYMYSGEPQGLSPKNMCEVYRIAHKYELGELVRLCVEFMKRCLSLETVCDVILLADVYQETGLKDCAGEFVRNYFAEVVETDEWKTLKNKNSSIVSELLEKILLKTLQI